MVNIPDAKKIEEFIQLALLEDVGDGDHTTLATIPIGQQGKAHLLVKDEGIIAGVELALMIFKAVDSSLYADVILPDGSAVKHQDIVLIVQGTVHGILKSERLVLNCMQRMSGIATQTRLITNCLAHTNTRVLDTRKTTPGFRLMEKWAVGIGGGVNHRFGLYDMILIKDNHVDFAGGIIPALEAVQRYLNDTGRTLKVVLEVRDFKELEQALEFGHVNRILLDNFKIPALLEAVKMVNQRVDTEASGSITPENAAEYAETGVTYISMGSITHSAQNFDLSLKAFT